jgi:transcription elongation factor Elf1
VTKPINDPNDMQRPRRRFTSLLNSTFGCPYCGARDVWGEGGDKGFRATYRRNSVRLECKRCGMRFRIDPGQVADAIKANTLPAVIEEYGEPRQGLGVTNGVVHDIE